MSSLVVVDANGKLEGLVTERDLVRKVCINDIRTSTVTNKEIMSSPLITIDSNSSPSIAAHMMLQTNVKHLLVVDESNVNKAVGIITPVDLSMLCYIPMRNSKLLLKSYQKVVHLTEEGPVSVCWSSSREVFRIETEQSMVSNGMILPALASAAKFKRDLQKLHIKERIVVTSLQSTHSYSTCKSAFTCLP